jgi:predicted transposase YdaD
MGWGTTRTLIANVVAKGGDRSNVAASAGILAGLTLKKEFINQVLRREIMQQSVIYQEWREEFLQEGRQEGEAELVLRLLTRRIGAVSPEVRSQIQTLSLTQIEALCEALLEFSAPSDLMNWLQANCPD